MSEIKDLKEVQALVVKLVQGGLKAYEDGKFDVADVIHLAPALLALQPALEGLSNVPEQIKALSLQEGLELIEAALAEFPQVPAKAVGVVKQASIVAIEVAKLVQVVKG